MTTKYFIEVFINPKNTVSFIDHKGYESRNKSTIALFREAFKLINIDKINVRHFYINTGDISSRINDTLTFGYTKAEGVITCPDFNFDKWIECGIEDYEKTVAKIIQRGNRKYLINKLFWIGNPKTQPLRYELLKLGELHKDKMKIIAMRWDRQFPKGYMHGYSTYVSLEDHTNYKYLIDCGARGYSGRVKFLLHSNRPLFLVERDKNKQEFFYKKLIPYKHYIPVKKDLSDLILQLEWAESNYNEALLIADNAKKFALKHLNRNSVINFLSNQLRTNLIYRAS